MISINGTHWSSWSFAYRALARQNCRMLFKQAAPCALFLALAGAGSSSAARIAMIAMTTSNSISVNAFFRQSFIFFNDTIQHG